MDMSADNDAIVGVPMNVPSVAISSPNPRQQVPGLLLAVVIGLLALVLGRYAPLIGGPVIGIVLGIIVRNLLSPGERYQPGIAFAGKYVLLDFWTTWCGPCHGDFPSLKLAQALYGDRGLSVVGIHDNSVPPALIAEHVKEQKLTFPIAIDVPDGRLVQTYTKLGLCSGYPSYLLLSPEGKVLDADSALPGPALRRFKLELIRAAIMGKGKDEG